MKLIFSVTAITLLILAVFLSISYAGAPQGLAYLTVGVGGKATGMGEAVVAMIDDPTAAYWNPAGLVGSPHSSAVFSYHRWIQDVSGQFAAGNYRRGNYAIALHYLGMNVDDIEHRINPSADPIGTFGAHDIALGISYARAVGTDLQLGATLKLLWESIYTESSKGWAFDVGVQHKGLIQGLALGAVLRNIGEMTALRNEGPTLPSRFRVGAAYHFFQIPRPQILLTADGEIPFEGDPNGYLGIEVRPLAPLALRGGYVAGIESRSFTAGFGMDWAQFHLNYGYAPFKEDLGDGHRFSIGLDF